MSEQGDLVALVAGVSSRAPRARYEARWGDVACCLGPLASGGPIDTLTIGEGPSALVFHVSRLFAYTPHATSGTRHGLSLLRRGLLSNPSWLIDEAPRLPVAEASSLDELRRAFDERVGRGQAALPWLCEACKEASLEAARDNRKLWGHFTCSHAAQVPEALVALCREHGELAFALIGWLEAHVGAEGSGRHVLSKATARQLVSWHLVGASAGHDARAPERVAAVPARRGRATREPPSALLEAALFVATAWGHEGTASALEKMATDADLELGPLAPPSPIEGAVRLLPALSKK